MIMSIAMGGIIGAISGAVTCMMGSSNNKKGIGAQKESPDFIAGKKLGYEEGYREGMNMRLQNSSELTQEEYEDLIRYLAERELIISYSQSFTDRFTSGLIVRKETNNKILGPIQEPGPILKPLRATIKLKGQQRIKGEDEWICTIRGERKIVNFDTVSFHGMSCLDIIKAINPEEIKELKIE